MAQEIFLTKILLKNGFLCMLEHMRKDFKSPVSTIPPRGQAVENTTLFSFREAKNARTTRTKPTQRVGTVAQLSAQPHKAIPQYALTPEFQEKFWARVKRGPSCWEWQGNLGAQEYGRLRVGSDRAHFRAHRVAYFIAFQNDPGEMLVCHKCDNPKCCNPAHLFLGTAQDNSDDKVAKGRWRGPEAGGEKNGNSKMSEAQARLVFEGIMEGKSNKQIASEVSVGHAMVSRMRNGRSWQPLAQEVGYTPKPSKMSPKSGRTKSNLIG